MISTITIDIQRTLDIYDTPDKSIGRHASSLKAISGEEMSLAVLLHFFRHDRQEEDAQLIDAPCKTKGARLDAWLYTGGMESILYQVEVKNWSVHGYGGGPLAYLSSMTAKEQAAYRTKAWDFYFDQATGRFKQEGLDKVLRSMGDSIPKGYETAKHKSLACLWTSLHHYGLAEPYFEVPVADGAKGVDFDSVSVFSVSTYLRNLLYAGQGQISLEMPQLRKRLVLLSEMFV